MLFRSVPALNCVRTSFVKLDMPDAVRLYRPAPDPVNEEVITVNLPIEPETVSTTVKSSLKVAAALTVSVSVKLSPIITLPEMVKPLGTTMPAELDISPFLTTILAIQPPVYNLLIRFFNLLLEALVFLFAISLRGVYVLRFF